MSIQNLAPRHLWQHFDRIRGIPRPSRHEEKIREHLLAWAKERMANYKVPRRVEIVDALPVNASGKVLKHELRERAKATR